jgi:ADP-ribosylglycohydrolase
MSKKGLLLGSILADAFSLGAHWIYDCDKIKQNFGEYDKIYDPLPDSFHTNRKKGEHTHYGDQSLLLLEFLAENGNFNKIKFQKFWAERMSYYDGYIDHATKATLTAIKENKEWGSNSSDLSGASRIAPIIYCTTDKEKGIKDSISQTRVTHNNEKVIAAAEFFARTAYAVLGGEKPDSAMDIAEKEMKNSYVTNKLETARKYLEMPSEKAIKEMGQACTVGGAFPATIYIILKYQEDYRKSMIANVMAGGDSAARGLLIGMILGAYREDTIPKEWMNEMCSLERVHF